MPSTCPKCHHVLEQDEICCAQVRYTWKCRACHKLTTGFALPYGKCFMCGGDLEVVEGRDLGDSMRFGFLTPKSYENVVRTGNQPALVVQDCGLNNTVEGQYTDSSDLCEVVP